MEDKMKNTLARISNLPPKKLALLVMELQSKLELMTDPEKNAIAVIGIGCRFPGGGDNPELFWQLLRKGDNGIIETPKERWDMGDYYDPNPEIEGKTYSRHGGFLKDVDRFDPEFFNITFDSPF